MRKEYRPKNIRVINYDKVLSGLQSILDKYDIPTETGAVSDILDLKVLTNSKPYNII